MNQCSHVESVLKPGHDPNLQDPSSLPLSLHIAVPRLTSPTNYSPPETTLPYCNRGDGWGLCSYVDRLQRLGLHRRSGLAPEAEATGGGHQLRDGCRSGVFPVLAQKTHARGEFQQASRRSCVAGWQGTHFVRGLLSTLLELCGRPPSNGSHPGTKQKVDRFAWPASLLHRWAPRTQRTAGFSGSTSATRGTCDSCTSSLPIVQPLTTPRGSPGQNQPVSRPSPQVYLRSPVTARPVKSAPTREEAVLRDGMGCFLQTTREGAGFQGEKHVL